MPNTPQPSLSSTDRRILQHVAHRGGEDTDNRDGWCRWSTSDRWPWQWDDYKPLVERGLLDRRESWKDVMLKLTQAGWMALYAAPADMLPEPRRDVQGQSFEGDLLP